MQELTRFLLAAILLLGAGGAIAQPPQNLWSQVYPNPTQDDLRGFNALQTRDGGFIICARHGAVFQPCNYYLIKTNINGDTVWTRQFDQDQTDLSLRVRQTRDGGYILAGWTAPWFTGSNWNILLIKTDASGNEQWRTVYGTPDLREWVNDIIQIQDGCYVVAGKQYNPTTNEWHLLLAKFNQSGQSLWQQISSSPGVTQAFRLVQTPEGGFAVVGNFGINSSEPSDAYLIKTDSLGNTLWEQTYNFPGSELPYGIRQTQDGGFILAGWHNLNGGWDGYVIKTDAAGQLVWSNIYGVGSSRVNDVLLTWKGDYIFTGISSALTPGNSNLWLYRTDPQGNLLWQTNAGWPVTSENANSIEYTSDGGYITAGCRLHSDSYQDCLLARWAGCDPLPQMALGLIPLNPPIVVPPGGGSFSFQIQFTNTDTAQVAYDAWSEVVLPDCTIYCPLLLRRYLNLPPGGNLTRILTQTVPAGYPAGTYLYRCKSGFYPDAIFAAGQFTFTKTGVTGPIGPPTEWGWEITGWEDQPGTVAGSNQPQTSILSDASPNPFNPSTAISYQLQTTSQVSLRVYDVSGRLVNTLVDGKQEAGQHQVTFDGSSLPSGVYLYRLTTGESTTAGKLVLLK